MGISVYSAGLIAELSLLLIAGMRAQMSPLQFLGNLGNLSDIS